MFSFRTSEEVGQNVGREYRPWGLKSLLQTCLCHLLPGSGALFKTYPLKALVSLSVNWENCHYHLLGSSED